MNNNSLITLKYVTDYTFIQCSNLNSFSIDDNNPYFSIENNLLFRIDIARHSQTTIYY